MTALTVSQALENIYESLRNDNDGIDGHINVLKLALTDTKQDSVVVESARLAQNNRQGRKMMQSYFKKHGVIVTFDV